PAARAPLVTAPTSARRQPFVLVCSAINPPSSSVHEFPARPGWPRTARRSLTKRRERGSMSLASLPSLGVGRGGEFGAHRGGEPPVGPVVVEIPGVPRLLGDAR